VAPLVGAVALCLAVGPAASAPLKDAESVDGSVVANLITLLTFSVVGALVASRHPRNAIGWLFCGVGVTVGVNYFAGDYAELWLATGFGPTGLGEMAAWFSSWAWILLTYIPTTFVLLLFPSGRPPSPRWRPVAWGAALGISFGAIGYALGPGPLADFPQIANPYGVAGPVVATVGAAGSTLAAGCMAASAVSLIVRLRRVEGLERQQIKWLAYGGALAIGTICAGGLIYLWGAPVGIAISSFSLLGLPVFTGVAIVKHGLYDIDVIINRTLVYGLLTAALAAVYVGGVASSQAALRAITGQESSVAVVASTLAIAALFGPLRRRLQGLVDRRFYRKKYDAAKTLEAFGTTLREETDLGRLREVLVAAVRETVGPEHASLWLRPRETRAGGPPDYERDFRGGGPGLRVRSR